MDMVLPFVSSETAAFNKRFRISKPGAAAQQLLSAWQVCVWSSLTSCARRYLCLAIQLLLIHDRVAPCLPLLIVFTDACVGYYHVTESNITKGVRIIVSSL